MLLFGTTGEPLFHNFPGTVMSPFKTRIQFRFNQFIKLTFL